MQCSTHKLPRQGGVHGGYRSHWRLRLSLQPLWAPTTAGWASREAVGARHGPRGPWAPLPHPAHSTGPAQTPTGWPPRTPSSFKPLILCGGAGARPLHFCPRGSNPPGITDLPAGAPPPAWQLPGHQGTQQLGASCLHPWEKGLPFLTSNRRGGSSWSEGGGGRVSPRVASLPYTCPRRAPRSGVLDPSPPLYYRAPWGGGRRWLSRTQRPGTPMARGSGGLSLTPALAPVYVSREEQPQKKERLPLRLGGPDPLPRSPRVNPCMQAAGVVMAEDIGAGAQSQGLWWKRRGAPARSPHRRPL